MKILQYNKVHNLSKLHDEILTAIPTLKAEPGGRAIIHLEGKDNDIWITVPDETNEQTIQMVVDTHNPTPDPSIIAKQKLIETDRAMVRIAEDLITTLIAKGAIALTDLPEAAREKIQQRQQLRSQLSAQ